MHNIAQYRAHIWISTLHHHGSRAKPCFQPPTSAFPRPGLSSGQHPSRLGGKVKRWLMNRRVITNLLVWTNRGCHWQMKWFDHLSLTMMNKPVITSQSPGFRSTGYQSPTSAVLSTHWKCSICQHISSVWKLIWTTMTTQPSVSASGLTMVQIIIFKYIVGVDTPIRRYRRDLSGETNQGSAKEGLVATSPNKFTMAVPRKKSNVTWTRHWQIMAWHP